MFIPLYPKLPILDIFGTWVYIRLEDFLVGIAVLFLGITVVWKKESLKTPLTLPIVGYWLVGLVSTAVAVIFIFPALSNLFPHIALLHYFRRIEYMVLFFLAFAVITRKKKLLHLVIAALVVTGIAIVLYGLGQKYAGWPAFSTMNEEFAKGVPLRLPPTARIMSTFAGHYDLAAYLVLTIPIFGSLLFGVKKLWIKLLLFCTTVSSFVLLLLTASRVSFGVYLLTISTMLWWQKKRWLIPPVIIGSIIMVNFVSGASDRFLKTLRFNDVVVDLSTGKPIGTLEKVEGGKAVLERISEPDEENLPKGSGFIGVPTAPQPDQGSGIGEVEYIKKKDLVAGKGDVATVSGSFLVQRAFVLDISITTRFQGQWPRAMEAFRRNMLTGSGFSSLSLAADGNYHRMLGETGIIGTVAFLGIFLYSFVWFFKKKDLLDPLERAFVVGLFAGIVGLLANAVLIDVFEASKVAFPLWMLLGVSMALLARHPLQQSYFSVLKTWLTSKYLLCAYFTIFVLVLFSGNIGSYFIGDDFTWLRWAAQSSLSDIPRYFVDSDGFFYRPIPKAWYSLLFSVFWLVPQAYHLASIGLFLGISLLMFFLLRRFGVRWLIASLITIVFAVLAVHHENVFWISGQSSLLAVFFFLLSMYFFLRSWNTAKRYQRWNEGAAVVFLCAAMASWESLIIAPIVVVLLGTWLFKKRSLFVLLALIPLYLSVRTLSGAVPPSGDYSYNVDRLLVNSVGNTITYTASILTGPKSIEYSEVIRDQLRSFSSVLTLIGIAGVGLLIAAVWKWKIYLFQHKLLIVLFGAYVVSLLPFLGLGAASERYALLPSVFLLVWIGVLVEKAAAYARFRLLYVLSVIGMVIVGVWNYTEINRLLLEWKFSGSVTEQTLRSIRTGFFPATTPPSFVFINTPIRYGRAWIFPTGLEDALWHMYRQTPFTVTQVQSLDQAFAYPHLQGTDKIILQFTDYKLQQIVKDSVAN